MYSFADVTRHLYTLEIFLIKSGVKMTLRSAARPRRALQKHSAGTCISSGTPHSHLCCTPITLVILFYYSMKKISQVLFFNPNQNTITLSCSIFLQLNRLDDNDVVYMEISSHDVWFEISRSSFYLMLIKLNDCTYCAT